MIALSLAYYSILQSTSEYSMIRQLFNNLRKPELDCRNSLVSILHLDLLHRNTKDELRLKLRSP